MPWHFNDITEAIAPILKIWKYIGLPVYELNKKNNKIITKNSHLCLIVIVLLVGIFLKFTFWLHHYANIESIMIHFQLCTIYFQTFSALIYYKFRQSSIRNLLNQFRSIEVCVFQFCQKGSYCKILRLRRKILIPIAVYIVIFLLILLGDILIMENSLPLTIYLILFYVGNVINLCFLSMLHFLLVIFNSLCKMFIYKLNEGNFDVKIVTFIRISLHELSFNINKTFEIFLAFKFFSDFVLIASQVFYSSYAVMTLNRVLNVYLFYFEIFINFAWTLLIFWFDYIIVKNFDLIYKQVKLFFLSFHF